MTHPAAVDSAVVEMMNEVFADYRDAHPPAPAVARDPDLWRALGELGLVRLTGAEASGGSGAGWYEAAELLTAAARHGVRVPLAENDLLAGWLLETAGIPTDEAVRTVCVLEDGTAACGVPWASEADRIVVVWRSGDEYLVADVDASDVSITKSTNMIGEPRDTVAVDPSALDGVAVSESVIETLRLKSALVRAIQVCAALDRALELSIEHVTSRIQFGRPLSKFQTVQNLVAEMATEAALARAATEAALTAAVTSDWSADNLAFLVAAARSCAGHAASLVVRNAHQAHGAIGTTVEHRLHEFTRAALAWRSEFGTVRYWDEWLADAARQAGGSDLWPLIVD